MKSVTHTTPSLLLHEVHITVLDVKPNLNDPDDGPRPKYWLNAIVSFIAIDGWAWVEAKKDV